MEVFFNQLFTVYFHVLFCFLVVTKNQIRKTTVNVTKHIIGRHHWQLPPGLHELIQSLHKLPEDVNLNSAFKYNVLFINSKCYIAYISDASCVHYLWWYYLHDYNRAHPPVGRHVTKKLHLSEAHWNISKHLLESNIFVPFVFLRLLIKKKESKAVFNHWLICPLFFPIQLFFGREWNSQIRLTVWRWLWKEGFY